MTCSYHLIMVVSLNHVTNPVLLDLSVAFDTIDHNILLTRLENFVGIKSNQIKSLLLSHHHSTSALVSEILMSVLQTVQKKQKNHLHMDRQCKKTALEHLQCSRQCKKQQQKNNNNLHMDRQCKKTALEHLQCSRQCKKKTIKNNNNLHMDRQCKKKPTNNLHMDRQCKKTALEHLQCSRQCKKKHQQFTYGQYIFTDCTEDNVQNTHTYTQYIVYYKDTLNYQRHIIHRMGTSTLCTVSIHNVVYT